MEWVHDAKQTMSTFKGTFLSLVSALAGNFKQSMTIHGLKVHSIRPSMSMSKALSEGGQMARSSMVLEASSLST